VQPKKGTSDYHHGNLRAALVQCGLELIEEQGIRALTLREIGARLGVSRSAAYGHFADKEALLAGIREAAFHEFGDLMEAAKDSTAGFAAQMDAMYLAYSSFAKEHPAQFRVMIDAFGDAAEPGRVFSMLQGIIQAAQEVGDVRPGDSAQLARVAWALIHGASLLQRDGAGSDFIRFSGEILRSGLNRG
jgi:AcrR family transcriptional regulator